jgi:acyl-CoA thioesterase II
MPRNVAWNRPVDEVLRIESAGEDAFSATLPGFGGVTLGCAALAAARTCPERSLHSLHTYFLRPVPPDAIVRFDVERVRDGRRFAHRRVEVRLDDRVLCEMMASFTSPGEGIEYQDALVDAATPAPETLPSEEEIARAEGWNLDEPGPLGGPLEWRWIGSPWRVDADEMPSLYRAWVRPRHPLPKERALNAAALAYLSDYHSHFPVARKLRGHFEPIGYTSLDQLLWVHRELFWDQWWLLTTQSDIGHAGRAFTRRSLHAHDGRLVASMAQEQLVPPPAGGSGQPT